MWRSPTGKDGSAPTKWSILLFTTGWDSRWRCVTSRSRTSRSATRASTCPIAVTICDEVNCAEGFACTCASGASDDRIPGHAAGVTRRFPGTAGSSRRSAAPRTARAVAMHVPRTRSLRTSSGCAIDLGRCLFCGECAGSCPSGDHASGRSTGWRLASDPMLQMADLSTGLRRLLIRNREVCLAVAEASPGERGRLQCLRGGHQRPRHGRFRPGPFWNSDCRLASPCRRFDRHGPGSREHAAGSSEDLGGDSVAEAADCGGFRARFPEAPSEATRRFITA